MQTILHINGTTHELKLDPRTTLLDALRHHLRLTGTKKGCDPGQCGACTVGRATDHCLPERDDYVGPLQAKGLGDLGICGAGSAVLNTVHAACEVRVRDFPATPDKIIMGMQP